jgi:hypothetical protein
LIAPTAIDTLIALFTEVNSGAVHAGSGILSPIAVQTKFVPASAEEQVAILVLGGVMRVVTVFAIAV